jgi:hypothetical protein
MYSQQSEQLARARMVELSRASNRRAKSRSSLRIMLDARRVREQSLVR